MSEIQADKHQLEAAAKAVLVDSVPMGDDAVRIVGPDFAALRSSTQERGYGITVDEILASMRTTGFQASNLGDAVNVIEEMRNWRSDKPDESQARTTIFLGYTSDLISSGLRESIRYLVQEGHVQCLVATAAGIKEDLIKCLGHTYKTAFDLDGKKLRAKGPNRIGNLVVPNAKYVKFEDWVMAVLDQALKEQRENGTIWTPSTLIHRLGREINDETSVCYWAYKNDIPIFSPDLTGGSFGDMIYAHHCRNGGVILDNRPDIRKIDLIAVTAKRTGMIILGSSVPISHTNLFRNGADYAVYINTVQEFDGSYVGAWHESVIWGKLKADARAVKVYADATLVFPLVVAGTFAKP